MNNGEMEDGHVQQLLWNIEMCCLSKLQGCNLLKSLRIGFYVYMLSGTKHTQSHRHIRKKKETHQYRLVKKSENDPLQVKDH